MGKVELVKCFKKSPLLVKEHTDRKACEYQSCD